MDTLGGALQSESTCVYTESPPALNCWRSPLRTARFGISAVMHRQVVVVAAIFAYVVLASAAPARAADPIFLPGFRIGLVPRRPQATRR
jgi:hypothetical protein